MEIDKTQPGWWSKKRAAEKTHCSKGHPRTPENVFTKEGKTGLFCKVCRDDWIEKRKAKQAKQ